MERSLPLAGEKSFELNNDPTVTERSAYTNRHQRKVSGKVPPFRSCVTQFLLFLERDLDCKF